MILKLVIFAFVNSILAILLYLFENKILSSKINNQSRPIINGILFGILTILSITPWSSVAADGAIVNLADAVPLYAGFIFGAPAGIIAGLIGGIYRYISVLFNGAGAYTQIASTLSIIVAGVVADVLRKFVFDNKKPTWLYGVVIALSVEILHMLLIFLVNINDATTAFIVVRQCAAPMLIGNAVCVGLVLRSVCMIGNERTNGAG